MQTKSRACDRRQLGCHGCIRHLSSDGETAAGRGPVTGIITTGQPVAPPPPPPPTAALREMDRQQPADSDVEGVCHQPRITKPWHGRRGMRLPRWATVPARGRLLGPSSRLMEELWPVDGTAWHWVSLVVLPVRIGASARGMYELEHR